MSRKLTIYRTLKAGKQLPGDIVSNLRLGLESLELRPDSEEKTKEMFELKRDFVLVLVEKVLIKKTGK